MEFSPYTISTSGLYQLQAMCPYNSFLRIPAGDLPIDLPEDLVRKSFMAVIVGSGDPAISAYMVNLHRAEARNNTIDQEPLIIACSNNGSNLKINSGFVHHGDWAGRTISVGSEFFQVLQGSGIMQYVPYVGIPQKNEDIYQNWNRILKGMHSGIV